MFSKILDLVIAVTLVYSIEAFIELFRGCEAKLLWSPFLSSAGLNTFVLYVVPYLALTSHIIQVAHYHQKRSDWRIEEILARKVEGFRELTQIMAISISVCALIATSRVISNEINKHYIVLLWFLAYAGYFLGDIITWGRIKEHHRTNGITNGIRAGMTTLPAPAGKQGGEGSTAYPYSFEAINRLNNQNINLPKTFVKAVKLIMITDFIGFVVSMGLFISCEPFFLYRWMSSELSLQILSVIIVVVTIINYGVAWDFLCKERPLDNS